MSALLNATAQTVAESAQFTFQTTDYVVFTLMLCISASIGVYFGFFAKGDDTTEEYLMGGKKMKTLPIAISLVASQLSAISIMSVPAEFYAFGSNFFLSVIVIVVVVPVLNYVIIPVFYNNNISNCYEYLEMRFNSATRRLQTFVFVVNMIFILPIFIFLPSLAFAQVTGFNVHIINAIVSSICVFYTMIGGIKAVVWTDVVQASIMVISVLLVGILGCQRIGGIGEVFRIAGDGGRLKLDFTLDLTTRATIWNTTITGFLNWLTYVGYNQSCVQRVVALPSLTHARRSLVLFGLGFLLIMSFNCFIGIVMYARYHDCDPLALGVVTKLDKMVPYFVQDIVGHLKGMPGVFISCVFSAALSTLSASINSLGGIVYFEYIKPHIHHTEHKANVIMKIFVFLAGIHCLLGGLIVEKFSSILQIVFSIAGVIFGSVFGIFTLGMLVPRVHGRAALIGSLAAIVCMVVIVVGSWNRNHYDMLPSSTDSCPAANATTTQAPFELPHLNSTVQVEALPTSGLNVFNMSFNWYSTTGFIVTWLVGILLSFVLSPSADDAKLDPNLLSPIIRPFVQGYEPAPMHELPELQIEKKEKIMADL